MLTPDNRNQTSSWQEPSQPARVPASFPVVPPSVPGVGGAGDEGCSLVTANLSAYLDAELEDNRKDFIEAHLNHCPTCARNAASLKTLDRYLQREWQESAPLPSSLVFKRSIDAIMDALPSAPEMPAAFAPRRVHARARWMRFAAGAAGMFALLGLLWSSYRLGYAHGRRSLLPTTDAPKNSPVLKSALRPNAAPLSFPAYPALSAIPPPDRSHP